MFDMVDANNFEQQVLHANGMVLVNFWAWWSIDCRKMTAVMNKIAVILDEVDLIVQIDWDQQKQLAQKLAVIGVPTLLIYFKGREVARYFGTIKTDDLLKQIIKKRGEMNNRFC